MGSLTPERISSREFQYAVDAIDACRDRRKLERIILALWQTYPADPALDDLKERILRKRAQLGGETEVHGLGDDARDR